MMKRTKIWVVLLLLCFAVVGISANVQAADNTDKASYVNDRFDFKFEYPADFIKELESANGDGIVLLSSDKKMTVVASGIRQMKEPPANLKTLYDSVLLDIQKDGAYLKSSQINGDYFVAHFISAKEELWVKMFVSPELVKTMTISRVPGISGEHLDKVAEELIKSFKEVK